MRSKLTRTALFVAAIVVLVVGAMKAQADPSKGSWTYERCLTSECIENRLNALSPEKAAEAKVTTWKDVVYIWYRK